MATLSEALAIAVAHHQAGRIGLADEIYRRILTVEPENLEALHLTGLVAHQRGQHAVAIEQIRRAIAIDGRQARFHSNLGEAYRALGRADEAIACYQQALQLNPAFAQAYNNLGEVYRLQGNLDEAIACYRRALEHAPRLVAAYNNLGIALQDQGNLDEALPCYRRAVELEPGFGEGHSNLASALAEQGRLDEAAACCRLAIELEPGFAEAYNNLGSTLEKQGNLAEAAACYRRALELWPDYAGARSNLLFALQHRDGITLGELAHAHAEYEQRHTAALRPTWPKHENVADPDRRLRVGFVSPDFGNHPVGYFAVRPLENLDPAQFEIVCYSDRLVSDATTLRFKAAASVWRQAFGLLDEQLAERIRNDRVDILFDLGGHTAGNRLLAFARKPAPIQITWAGYAGTTGLAAMDYLLADGYEVPPEAEPHYCEKVLRMPDGYLCFDPPADAPPVGPLPALETGHVTFGCFNSRAKITPRVIQVWGEILGRSPQSRLLLISAGLDGEVGRRLLGEFAARGIDASRLEFRGRLSRLEVLEHYHRVDLAMDPFPFGGGLTTCEALWMGVPVITCPGETFAGRHALSHLSVVGLTDGIAGDVGQYQRLAAELAADLPRLAEIRKGLRRRVADSPLCDGKRFADNLAAILRDVWRQWCRSAA